MDRSLQVAVHPAKDLPSEVDKVQQQVSEVEKCCAELRNVLQLLDGRPTEYATNVLLKITSCTARLKWLNRLSHLTLEGCKLAVQKRKEEVQNCRIVLENYLYQREQLKDEIASCQSYHGLIEEISLITAEEAHICVAKEGLDDCEYEHQVMLARLEAEKERRRSLEKQVEELKQKKRNIETELNQSRQFLENLPSEIEKIHSAATRVSTFFHDYGFTGRSSYFLSQDTWKRMFLLPFSLYILARQAFAFQRTFEGDKRLHFKMDIIGDVDAAETIYKQRNIDWSNVRDENLYQMHPLQLQLELGGQPDGALDVSLQRTFTATFSYLLYLEIVVVSFRGSASDGNLSTEQFTFLFPGDDGSHSPNPANCYLQENQFHFQPSKVGGARPFIWAQIICGLGFPFELNLSSSSFMKDAKEWLQNASNYSKHVVFGAVIKALLARNYFLQSLSMQLVSLQRLIVPVNAKEAQLPGDPRSELKSWSEWTEHQEMSTTSSSSSAYSQTGTRKFLLEIQSESIHLRGLVAVCPDYPLTSPYWSLKCIRGPLQDSDLRDIERELVSFTDENWEGNTLGENLLSIQVKKLQACVDICEEINRPSHDSMVERPRWDRSFRGRMRTKPFVFNSKTNVFEPRIG